jgi:hypothetical protein
MNDTGIGRLHEGEGAVHCYAQQTCSVLLHCDSSERCVCPLYKFVYSFTVIKLFLKHPILTPCMVQRTRNDSTLRNVNVDSTEQTQSKIQRRAVPKNVMNF